MDYFQEDMVYIFVTLIYVIGSVARHYAYYGMGSGPILLSSLSCTGRESSLLECDRNMYSALSCTHRSDAGVTCEGNSSLSLCNF